MSDKRIRAFSDFCDLLYCISSLDSAREDMHWLWVNKKEGNLFFSVFILHWPFQVFELLLLIEKKFDAFVVKFDACSD